MELFNFAVEQARRFNAQVQAEKRQAPTEQDHRLAEHRGLSLCDHCGKELAFPGEYSQLCGRCELELEARR